eukprot:scaffold11494_cov61-Cyclotella_meneghiniana.AAC.1
MISDGPTLSCGPSTWCCSDDFLSVCLIWPTPSMPLNECPFHFHLPYQLHGVSSKRGAFERWTLLNAHYRSPAI